MKHILLGYTFSLLLIACTAEEDIGNAPSGGGQQPVLLQPNFYTGQPSTRATKGIVNGLEAFGGTHTPGKISTVMLYVTKTDGHIVYPGVEDDTTDDLVAGLSLFKATGGGTLKWEGKPAVNLYNEQARVFAFSPSDATFVASTSNEANHKITGVNIPAAMTFGADELDCNTIDYLYGSGSGEVGTSSEILVSNATSGNNTFKPDIHLQHALAQIVFKLQTTSGRPVTEYDFVKSIKLEATEAFLTGENGAMQIADGTISGLSSASTLTLTPSANPVSCGNNGQGNIVAYGLVAPIASAPSSVTLTITLSKKEDNTNRRELSVTSTNFNVKWEKGKRYVYNLTLSDRSIVPDQMEIKEWTNSASGTGTLEPDLKN